jgi:hypothetical protein
LNALGSRLQVAKNEFGLLAAADPVGGKMHGFAMQED